MGGWLVCYDRLKKRVAKGVASDTHDFTTYFFFSDHPSEELLNQLECKCCDCGKSFDSADQLNTHLQLVHLREVSLGTIHILRKHFYSTKLNLTT